MVWIKILKQRRNINRLKLIFLLLSTIIFCLVFAEIILRIHHVLTDSGTIEDANKYSNNPETTGQTLPGLGSCVKRSDNPELLYEFIPKSECGIYGTHVDINSQGLRDYEYAIEKPNDTFRIIALGDSYTFGWGLELDEMYTKLLELYLNNNSIKKYEIINFGGPNYNTLLELKILELKAINYNPDLIIIGYTPGDPECPWDFCDEESREYTIKAYGNTMIIPGVERTLKQKIFQMLFLYKKYDDTLSNLGIQDLSDSITAKIHKRQSPTWRSVQDSFKRIAQIAKENNAEVILIVFPELDYMIQFKSAYEEGPLNDIQQQVIKEGKLNGFQIIDVVDYYNGIDPFSLSLRSTFPEGDGHPNAEANKIVAEAICEHIKNDKIF